MTTIVIDFKNKLIAADKQSTCNMMVNGSLIKEQIFYKQCSKIHLVSNDEEIYLLGVGDNYEISRQSLYVARNGHVDNEVLGNCDLVIVRVKGDGLFADIYKYKTVTNWYGKKIGKFERTSLQGDNNVITFGSGGDYAYGAFMAGCTAEEAVIAASKCDVYTSHEVDVVKFGEL